MKISAVIITKNEASNIERCLNALTGIADEIIVVDAYSQDATPDICATYPNVRFHTKSWQGCAASKNYGNNLAGHDYILSVDADEVLSEALRKELTEIKAELEPDKAYVMPRLNHIGNTKIKYSGWYPDKKIALISKKISALAGRLRA